MPHGALLRVPLTAIWRITIERRDFGTLGVRDVFVVTHEAGGSVPRSCSRARASAHGRRRSGERRWPGTGTGTGTGTAMLDLEEGNLRHGLLALVVALLERVKEARVYVALAGSRGRRSDAEVERLGDALAELEEVVAQIKAEHGMEDAVQGVRNDLDQVVSKLIDTMIGRERWSIETERTHAQRASDGAIEHRRAMSASARPSAWRLGSLSPRETTSPFPAARRAGKADRSGDGHAAGRRTTHVRPCAPNYMMRLAYRPTPSAPPRSCSARRRGASRRLGGRASGRGRDCQTNAELNRAGGRFPVTDESSARGHRRGLGRHSRFHPRVTWCTQATGRTAEPSRRWFAPEPREPCSSICVERFRRVEPALGPPVIRYEAMFFDRRSGSSRRAVVAARRVGRAMMAGVQRSADPCSKATTCS